jgi:hypothetical protein
MSYFSVGDCVRWHRDVLVHEVNLIGIIRTVIYDDGGHYGLSLFEVEFAFGRLLLRSAQLVHVSSASDQSIAA